MDQKSSSVTVQDFKSYLPPRSKEAHKGMFGPVFIFGGDKGMGGAVCLAGEAALRVGAGLVTIGTQAQHIGPILSRRPELMVREIEAFPLGWERLSQGKGNILLGPGLGQTAWSYQVFKGVIALSHPMVIDADGLNLLAREPQRRENWILTPHPGEAARLLHCSVAEIQMNRIGAVEALQKSYGGVIVLKGRGTLIGTESCLYQCDLGNPGMATPGMGDVLGGVMSGLIAQDLPLPIAAALGVCLHATAGDLAAAELGERGLVARDLMGYLQKLVNFRESSA